jgi:MFS family permease
LIVLMGAASIGFLATANASLQLGSKPSMRGRVMALYAMAFLGTTPIGAPLVGAIAEWTSPRMAILAGALATVVAAGLLTWRHEVGRRQSAQPGGAAVDGAVEQVAIDAA